jgi:biopolymer transport protein ExbB
MVAGPVSAQAAKAPTAPEVTAPEKTAPEKHPTPPPEQTMRWRDILKSGGFLMYVLGALSVLGLAFVIYFFAVLRASQVAPRSLRRELLEKIRTGVLDDVRRSCEYHPCPLSAVILTAIDHLRASHDMDAMMLKDVVEAEGRRQADGLQGQTQYLYDIAVIAPMLGLLGTVLGVLKAFSGIAYQVASAKPVQLAQGLSQALVTTAFGLMVGIAAMLFYSYFRRAAAKLVSHLETESTDMMTALLNKRPM